MLQGKISEGMSAKLSQATLALSVSTFRYDICVLFGFWGVILHASPLGTQWYLLKKKINKEKYFLTIHTFKSKQRREDIGGVFFPFKCTFFGRKPVAGRHQSSFDKLERFVKLHKK